MGCCFGDDSSSGSSSSNKKPYQSSYTSSSQPRQQPSYQVATYQQPRSQPSYYQSQQVQRQPPPLQRKESEGDDGIYIGDNESKNKILNKLRYTNPSGGTALRDAICAGLLRQIGLKTVLMKSRPELFQNYKFINIVLTDGEDTKSETTPLETKKIFYLLNEELPGACETFLIGVNLASSAQDDFRDYLLVGQGSVHFENVSDMDVGGVFERIQATIGIETRAAMVATEDIAVIGVQRELVLKVREQKYAILFILDMSGSMSGHRWKCVVQAMTSFFSKMEETDLFCCMLFNDKPKFL
jgi:hypothetical protein